ncbi:MAG: NAD(P)H-hydrate epimerase [Bacteroidetes bacterium]|nr:NAD(P)H-hydrate epimerase [Bacteroidota bacterium]
MIKEFVTNTGLIVLAVTKEQMIKVDRIAVEEIGPNLFQMMENAGRNLALTSIELILKRSLGKRIMVFAGTGGNGGGGICGARHLLNHGYEPIVILSNEKKMQEIPAYQLGIFRKAGGEIIPVEKAKDVRADLIIDAIIGYSLISAPRGNVLEMINFINRNNIPTISLDIPTGVLVTSGENPGEFVKPEITLTLALPKTGLYPDKCGEIILADVGIPKVVYEKIGLKYNSPFSDKYIIPISVKE